MPDIVVLNLDVKDLNDPRLLSLMDEPLVNWTTRYHKDGLRKLLRTAGGTNYPIRSWGHLRESEPTLDEIRAEFAAADNADGICAVLDGTPFVVLDLNGSPDHARRSDWATAIALSTGTTARMSSPPEWMSSPSTRSGATSRLKFRRMRPSVA